MSLLPSAVVAVIWHLSEKLGNIGGKYLKQRIIEAKFKARYLRNVVLKKTKGRGRGKTSFSSVRASSLLAIFAKTDIGPARRAKD